MITQFDYTYFAGTFLFDYFLVYNLFFFIVG